MLRSQSSAVKFGPSRNSWGRRQTPRHSRSTDHHSLASRGETRGDAGRRGETRGDAGRRGETRKNFRGLSFVKGRFHARRLSFLGGMRFRASGRLGSIAPIGSTPRHKPVGAVHRTARPRDPRPPSAEPTPVRAGLALPATPAAPPHAVARPPSAGVPLVAPEAALLRAEVTLQPAGAVFPSAETKLPSAEVGSVLI